MVKDSEYQRCYTPGFGDYLRESYEDNLEFRNLRRKAECWHSIDPFSWNAKDLTDVSSDIDLNVIEKRPTSAPLFRQKHEKFNQDYREKHTPRKAIEQSTGTQTSQKSISLTPSTDVKKQSEPNVLKIELPKSPDEQPGTKTNPAVAPHCTKPQNPKNKISFNKAAKPRPSTAPIKASKNTPVQHAPLVCYGYRDKGLETARKKTHNVRASSDVYKCALSAAKRRQAEKDNKKKHVSSKPTFLEIQKAQFLERMRRETANWETEYKGNYASYDNTVYSKSLVNRLDPHNVWQKLYAQ